MIDQSYTPYHYGEEKIHKVYALSNCVDCNSKPIPHLKYSYFWGLIRLYVLLGYNGDVSSLIDVKEQVFSQTPKLLNFIWVRDMRCFNSARHSEYVDFGFSSIKDIKKILSLVVDISKPGNINYKKRWRKNLRRAHENFRQLIVQEVNDAQTVKKLYDDLAKIKGLNQNARMSHAQIDSFFSVYEDALTVYGLKNDNNEIISVRGYLSFEDYAIDIFAASNQEGRDTGASYILLDYILTRLSQLHEKKYYDLNGVDPKNNHGVYLFKSGVESFEFCRQGSYLLSNSFIGKLLIKIIELTYRFK